MALGFLATTWAVRVSKKASKDCDVDRMDALWLKSTLTNTNSSTVPVVHEGDRRPANDFSRLRKSFS